MRTIALELRPDTAAAAEAAAHQVVWPAEPGRTDSMIAGLGWGLQSMGSVDSAAADLLRIAAGAYCLDRLARRPTSWSRDLHLTVHVENPGPWQSTAGQLLVDLLAWLTGDDWELDVRAARAAEGQTITPIQVADVRLLSGGLDSLCGAVIDLASAGDRLHLGYADAATAVRHAQERTNRWLYDRNTAFTWTRLELRPTKTLERTTRSRSLLFMALAIAAASGSGAATITVPENGFTSVNLPLQQSRGGALSTKSTHPWTFHQIADLAHSLSMTVSLVNPHAAQTKGELLSLAAKEALDGFAGAAAATLSCSKLDGRVIAGGNANHHCGLCVACVVRRGSYLAAAVPDETIYLIETLNAAGRRKLIDRRRDDLDAITEALARPVEEDDVRASAVWPPGTNMNAILDLIERGHRELALVPLP